MSMENNENETKELTIAEETMQMCKILYCQKDLPMTKTCMCWGWECGEGWHEILKRLSCELEALNLLYYDKYKVRIQADQVKEKFGTLRFYHTVVCDNYNEIGIEANKVIDAFETKQDNGYFGLKSVCDQKAYYTDEKDNDGKLVKVWHPAKYHTEVTLHKEEYEQMKAAADEAHKRLVESGYDEITPEQKVIMEYLDSEANARIRKAEDDCYNVCEHCGWQIGTEYSPRCETSGWITYICEKCATKVGKDGRETFYYKDGALYEGKKIIKTKEQVKAERDAFEAKMDKLEEENESSDEEAENIQKKFNDEIVEAMNEDKK